jgi:VIT1/CCC1 family predicted Fe2+/Mn2+ transporter
VSTGRQLAAPVIFGLADGCMTMLGVLLYLLHDQKLIFPAALMGGISAAVSMAGGEWMSDSDNGFGAAAVMGLATGLGAIAPAVPFLFVRGPLAIGLTVAVCAVIAAVVGIMRGRASTRHALWFEVGLTYALFCVIFAVVLVCAIIVPVPG